MPRLATKEGTNWFKAILQMFSRKKIIKNTDYVRCKYSLQNKFTLKRGISAASVIVQPERRY